MPGPLERLTNFLREHALPVALRITPDVQIDYNRFSDPEKQVELTRQWNDLRAMLDSAPGVVTSSKWRDWGSGTKYEEVEAVLDGVRVKLSGPHIPSDKRENRPQLPRTPQEAADQALDSIMSGTFCTSLPSILPHISRTRLELLRDMVNHALGERSPDPALTDAVVERVLRVLQVRSLTAPPSESGQR